MRLSQYLDSLWCKFLPVFYTKIGLGREAHVTIRYISRYRYNDRIRILILSGSIISEIMQPALSAEMIDPESESSSLWKTVGQCCIYFLILSWVFVSYGHNLLLNLNLYFNSRWKAAIMKIDRNKLKKSTTEVVCYCVCSGKWESQRNTIFLCWSWNLKSNTCIFFFFFSSPVRSTRRAIVVTPVVRVCVCVPVPVTLC